MESVFQFNSRDNRSPDIFLTYHSNRKPSVIYDIYMKVLQNLIPKASITDVLDLFMSISNNSNSSNGELRTNAVLGICAIAFKDLIPVGRCEEVVDALIKESHDSFESSSPEYHLVDDWGSLREVALWGIKLIAEKGRLHANQTEKVIDVLCGRVDDTHPHIRRNAVSALTEIVTYCPNILLSRADQLYSIFHQHAVEDLEYIREWSVQGIKELAKRDLLMNNNLVSEVLSMFLTNITHSQNIAIRAHSILGLTSLLINQRVPKNMIEQCRGLLLLEAQSDPSGAVSCEAFVAIAQLLRAGTWGVEGTAELVRLVVDKIECDPNGAPHTVITVSACLLVVGELAARLVEADTLGELLLLLVAKASDSNQDIARNALIAINQCVIGRSMSAKYFPTIAQVMLGHVHQCNLDSNDSVSSLKHSDVVTVALCGLGSLAECNGLPQQLVVQIATLLLQEVGFAEPYARHRMLKGLMALVDADRLSFPLVDEVVDLMVAVVDKSFKGTHRFGPHDNALALSSLSSSSSTNIVNGDLGEQKSCDAGEAANQELLRTAIGILKTLSEGDVLVKARQTRIRQMLTTSETTESSSLSLHLDSHSGNHKCANSFFTTMGPSSSESARVLVLSEEIAAMGEHLRELIAVKDLGSDDARHILDQIESHLIKNEIWQGKIRDGVHDGQL